MALMKNGREEFPCGNRLRIQHCLCRCSGSCCGTGLILGLGTSTCSRCCQKKEKRKKRKGKKVHSGRSENQYCRDHLQAPQSLYSWPTMSFACVCLFLGLLLWYTEVSRLGVEAELQMPAYATATPDPSCICNLHHRLMATRDPFLARDQTCILMDTS